MQSSPTGSPSLSASSDGLSQILSASSSLPFPSTAQSQTTSAESYSSSLAASSSNYPQTTSTESSSIPLISSSSLSFESHSSASLTISSVISLSSAETIVANSAQLPSPSTSVTNHVLRPRRDASVDRSSLRHRTPSNSLNLFYADSAGTYTSTVAISLDNNAQGILLENIDAITSVACTNNEISFTVNGDAAAAEIANWPVGTLLFTLADGCNTADERGIYALAGSTNKLRRQTPVSTVRYQASSRKIEQLVARWNDIWAKAKADLATAVAAQQSASAQSTPTSPAPTPATTASEQLSSPPPAPTAVPECDGFYPGGARTVAGTPYTVYCGKMATYPTTKIDTIAVASFADCIVACTALAHCKGAQFREAPQTDGQHECSRWSELAIPNPRGKSWAGKYDVALKNVEPAPPSSLQTLGAGASSSTGGVATLATSVAGAATTSA
ncbi:hypothetical protein ACN47E_007223 [Coniothyrium glycines]